PSENDVKFAIFNKYGTSQIYICGDYFNPNSTLLFGCFRGNNRDDTFSQTASINLLTGQLTCGLINSPSIQSHPNITLLNLIDQALSTTSSPMHKQIKFLTDIEENDHTICYKKITDDDTTKHQIRIIGTCHDISRVCFGYYDEDWDMQPFNNKLEINCQNGNLSTNGTIYYGELTQQSSKMFKTNIQTISDEIIDEILNINAKMYIKNNQNEIGLILEELIDNCPLLSKYLASYLEINELNPEIKTKIDNKYIITKNNKKYVPY